MRKGTSGLRERRSIPTNATISATAAATAPPAARRFVGPGAGGEGRGRDGGRGGGEERRARARQGGGGEERAGARGHPAGGGGEREQHEARHEHDPPTEQIRHAPAQ